MPAGNSPRLTISISGQSAVLQWPSTAGERFQVEHQTNLSAATPWQLLATNLAAGSNAFTAFVHSNALLAPSSFYRLAVITSAPPAFTFNWTGTNFTYADSNRSFTGILLKPDGDGPFPAVVINHGAG